MKELVIKLNELELIQKSIDWIEDIPEEMWKEYFEGKYKESNMDDDNIDKHRWYELADRYYEVGNSIIGVNQVTQLYSESMMVEDCYHKLTFFLC